MNLICDHHLISKPIKKASLFSRILNNRSRKKKYEHIERSIKNNKIHNGQRKLLMSEIEFITTEYKKLKNDNKILLYIGASKGISSIHTYTLARLFPEFEYHLYDKYDFFPKLYELNNVKIFKRWFTDNDSKNYKNKNVLLVSDLRDPDIEYANTINKINSKVFDDMKFQMKLYNDIKPVSALLKFRLPWITGKTEYLDGDIYYQVWQGKHSTETRLIPNNKMKIYDNTSYEERLFYFNTETRIKYYKHNYECYGHCYDCRSELDILEKYIKLKKLKMCICTLGKKITEELSFYNSRPIFTSSPLNKFKI